MADYDVFLYFSGDPDEKSNWDSEFSYYLGLVLRQIMDTPPRMMSNIKVPGATFHNENDRDISKVKAIVLITGKEDEQHVVSLKYFLNNLAAKNHKNYFIVRRPQRRISTLPEHLAGYPVYNFFEMNQSAGEVIEFKAAEHENNVNSYWEKLTDLAYDIKQLICADKAQDISTSRTNTIYLAEVSIDQSRNRDQLKRELLLSGYRVIPENPLPLSLKEFEDAVCSSLENSVLSVHLMGEIYGDTSENSDYSYPEIQNRLFIDVAKKLQGFDDVQPKISRIVWVQPTFEPYDEKQIQYLKRLKREISSLANSEYIQSSLHELKNVIDSKFTQIKKPVRPNLNQSEKDLLLIADDYRDIVCGFIKEEALKSSLNLTLLKTLTGVQDIGNMMSELKKYKNVLILNTKNDRDWLFSVLNLLARSKGYVNAVFPTVVGLFSPSQMKKMPEIDVLAIEPYVYSSKNINDMLDSFIKKIKA